MQGHRVPEVGRTAFSLRFFGQGRAVTIRVGAATGHAGLIDPGDPLEVVKSTDLASPGAL